MATALSRISNRHPCFSEGPDVNQGRIHLPVSPACNIRCGFCTRIGAVSPDEQRPGQARRVIAPEEGAALVTRALELAPRISVVGIAGPGDTLATDHALRTFRLVHAAHPTLIMCMSTNGLLLERYIDDLLAAGVQTLTVTVNAVDAKILAKICGGIVLDGLFYDGEEGAVRLIAAQERGIRLAAKGGLVVKINTVLIPAVNDAHIGEIARRVKDWGALILNVIPLIPSGTFAGYAEPTCNNLAAARAAAETLLPVFKHCQHCRADACGIPGKSDVSAELYAGQGLQPVLDGGQTFSHG